MEAKDTVMNPHDAIDAYNHGREKYEEEQEALEQPILQSQSDNAGVNGHSLAQAEISFKAGQEEGRNYETHQIVYNRGKKDGLKEVVDTISAMIAKARQPNFNLNLAEYFSEQWQTKLREWGINGSNS